MSKKSIEDVMNEIRNASSTEIDLICGTSFNLDLQGDIVVTVIATGFDTVENKRKKGESTIESFTNRPVAQSTPQHNINVGGGHTEEHKDKVKQSKVPSWLQNRFK